MTKLYELEEYICEAESNLKFAIEEAKGWVDGSAEMGNEWPAMAELLKNLEAALELVKIPTEIKKALRIEAETGEADYSDIPF